MINDYMSAGECENRCGQSWQSRHSFDSHGLDVDFVDEDILRDGTDPHEDPHHAQDDYGERAAGFDEDELLAPGLRRRQPKSVILDTNAGAFREIRARLVQLEAQTVQPSGNETSSNALGGNSSLDAAGDADARIDESMKGSFDHQQTIPELVEKTWPEFMNKDNRITTESALEILTGEPDYYYPLKTQDKTDSFGVNEKPAVASAPRTPGALPPEDGPIFRTTPDRIRINSPLILNVLASIDRHVDASACSIMLRPYKVLVFHEDRIREYVRRLQDQIQDIMWTHDELEARKATLRHMFCLLRFFDLYIRPTIDRFMDCSQTKIEFKDLWYIFPPGEDIFFPLKRLRGAEFRDAMDATPETFVRRYNMLWRITGTGGGRRDLAGSQDHDTVLKIDPFQVNCYYVDFDGKFFLPTTHTFGILPYKGEREIATLDFFPLRFMKDSQQRLREHTEKGKEIFRTITTGFTHFYYTGLTMTTQPCGCPLQSEPMHQEWIESEVIVDYKTALLRHPSWRPKPNYWKAPPRHEREVQERCRVRYWTDDKRRKLARSEYDYIHDDYHIDKELATSFRNNEQIFAPIPSGWASNAEMVPKKDVGLLAGRAFAFVLRTRSFAPLWLWALSPIKAQKESLSNLQLRNNGFKDTIQKLVNSHFRQTAHNKNVKHDVIQGKGRGLVILLHGAPGVGKTSTAEAVAAASGKPLFQITCGDLGLTPSEVERALKEIFRYAQIWNCVLLFDECDVFLAQRQKNDIIRNGLVSVFLRTLEVYTGVLFLTTNRVGVLDEAIRSRLTYTEFYPPLDDKQTKEIWKMNLRLLKERNNVFDVDEKGILKFAREHFRFHAETGSTWNGRQIQTAFKVATALADYDDAEEASSKAPHDQARKARPKLLPYHFEVVARGHHDFKEYIKETLGCDDDERAYDEMVRAREQRHRPEPFETQPQDDYRRGSSSSPVQFYGRSNNAPTWSKKESYPNSQSHGNDLAGRRRSSHLLPNQNGSGHNLPSMAPAVRHRRSSNLTTVHAHSSVEAYGHSPRSGGYWPPHHNSSAQQMKTDISIGGSEASDSSVDHSEPNMNSGFHNHRAEREGPSDEEGW